MLKYTYDSQTFWIKQNYTFNTIIFPIQSIYFRTLSNQIILCPEYFKVYKFYRTINTFIS